MTTTSSSCLSHGRLPASGALLLLFLALTVRGAGPVVLSPQSITVPASTSMVRFVDVDGDGRSDLLVLDPEEKKLLIYHQHPDGFTNAPDQVIALPPQTAWVAPCDVDAHPGLELLMSTAAGLVYSRQDAGLFESERRPLITASQVFTNFDSPFLALLNTNKAGTNDSIPVISARQAVLYHRNSAYEWSPGPPLAFHEEPTGWYVGRDWRGDNWTLGPNPAHHLQVYQSLRTKPEPKRDQQPENDTIRKIIDDMKKTDKANPPQMPACTGAGEGMGNGAVCARITPEAWSSRARGPRARRGKGKRSIHSRVRFYLLTAPNGSSWGWLTFRFRWLSSTSVLKQGAF
jgi:hypothetical protein